MNNVLVIGSSGLVGTSLCNKLNQYCTVFTYQRKYSNQDRCFFGDFFSEKNFYKILKNNKIDAVYHLISDSIPSTPMTANLQLIYSATKGLIQASIEAKVKDFIFVSSGGCVYGENINRIPSSEESPLKPICYYGLQKVVLETLLLTMTHGSAMKPKIVRPSNIYGSLLSNNGQGIIPIFKKHITNGERIVLYGDTVRDYIHIDDVIDGLIDLGFYHGDKVSFNLGTGIGTYTSDLLKQIQILIKTAPVEIDFQERRLCDVDYNVLDISRASRELCWNPKISLVDGLKKLLVPHNI